MATPYRRYHNRSFTTTMLHHSTQACWKRTASSRQNIYHNHQFGHRIRLPRVACQSDNKTNKPARKHSEKGHAHYIFVECVITTPSLLPEYQRWQTRERRCADLVREDAANQPQAAPSPAAPKTCNYSFRNTRTYGVPRCKTNRFKNSFVPYGLYNWQ